MPSMTTQTWRPRAEAATGACWYIAALPPRSGVLGVWGVVTCWYDGWGRHDRFCMWGQGHPWCLCAIRGPRKTLVFYDILSSHVAACPWPRRPRSFEQNFTGTVPQAFLVLCARLHAQACSYRGESRLLGWQDPDAPSVYHCAPRVTNAGLCMHRMVAVLYLVPGASS